MKRSHTMFNIKTPGSDDITPISYYTYYCDACSEMVGVSEDALTRVSNHVSLCAKCHKQFMGLPEEFKQDLINAISTIYESKKTIKNILEENKI